MINDTLYYMDETIEKSGVNIMIMIGIYSFFIVIIIVYFYFEYKSIEDRLKEISKKNTKYKLEIERLSEANSKLVEISLRKDDGDYQEKISREILSLLTEVGTGLWRIREALLVADEGMPRSELISVFRPFDSTWNKLAQAGLEIKGHNGDIIKGGEALHIIAFQTFPGINTDTVIETLRPTIYYRGRIVQMGEVIVGKPVQDMV